MQGREPSGGGRRDSYRELSPSGSPLNRPDAGQLLDLAPDAIIGVRSDGRIEFTNTRVETVFGYTRAELIGQPIEALLPERYRSRHAEQRAGYFLDGRTRPMGAGLDLWGLHKDGSEFPCQISLSTTADEEGLLAIAAIREAGEHPLIDRPEAGGSEDAAGLLELIEQERVQIVFQPIVRLDGREVVGYEALSRFEIKPELGPLHWFDLAARLGLTTRLEILAVQKAVAAFAEADADVPADAFISVNASPETLRLAGVVEEILGESISHDRVVVEVTEHAEIADYRAFDDATEALWDSGIRLAVDDVGAGYASLRHLLNVDPDFIKLDLELTRDINSDSRRRVIARGLTAFADEAESAVIAEGIETDQEIESLRDLGVELGQGYHIGRPGPLPPQRDVRPA